MSNIKTYQNKVVVITGAAGGLGAEFARAFHAAGARVALCDINVTAAAEIAASIDGDAAGNTMSLKVDVTDEGSTAKMAEEVAAKWGRIDILVNNAAIYYGIVRKPFYELETTEWDRVINVNLKGVWMTSKAAFPYMKEAGGRIVNISSATFMSGSPIWSHYVASKGGVIGLTRSMAREAGDHNITVNAVAPGFTLTDASLSLMDNAREYGVQRGAIKRGCEAEDIVGAVLFMASDDAGFITGQTLVVDGGRQFI